MTRHFAAAPWPPSLKAISAIAVAGLAVAGYFAHGAVPSAAGSARALGLAIAATLPAIALASALFVVRSFALEGAELRVTRLLWSTRVPLAGLRQAWHQPDVCRGSLRVFGNGGLFSFTGLYWSRTLGRYRLFGTDLKKAVALTLPDRTVVITPADPGAFVAALRERFPAVGGAPSVPRQRP